MTKPVAAPVCPDPATARRSVERALSQAADVLRGHGVAEPRREARLLLRQAGGLAMETMIGHPDHPLTATQTAQFDALVRRRAAGEPFAYIAGAREFWSLSFSVSPATLIPRPDSETIINAVLALHPNREPAYRILDLGTGSGCLLLALLSEFRAATGLGVDLSASAIEVAAGNAERLGFADRCHFMVGTWGRAVSARFDIIVANPPYIAEADLAGLSPDIKSFEPRDALDGGPDGLAAYRDLTPDIGRLLAPSGTILVEIGAGQARAVTAMFAAQGLASLRAWPDLSGVDRCISASANPRAAAENPEKAWNIRNQSLGYMKEDGHGPI